MPRARRRIWRASPPVRAAMRSLKSRPVVSFPDCGSQYLTETTKVCCSTSSSSLSATMTTRMAKGSGCCIANLFTSGATKSKVGCVTFPTVPFFLVSSALVRANAAATPASCADAKRCLLSPVAVLAFAEALSRSASAFTEAAKNFRKQSSGGSPCFKLCSTSFMKAFRNATFRCHSCVRARGILRKSGTSWIVLLLPPCFAPHKSNSQTSASLKANGSNSRITMETEPKQRMRSISCNTAWRRGAGS
mmetsp:Transcript_54235/g.116445  ORF Transcript_54235/g.116445 Transcript_54235/m.116445 type:complete len:248 (+) Transcript_54235:453-1196(+)